MILISFNHVLMDGPSRIVLMNDIMKSMAKKDLGERLNFPPSLVSSVPPSKFEEASKISQPLSTKNLMKGIKFDNPDPKLEQ